MAAYVACGAPWRFRCGRASTDCRPMRPSPCASILGCACALQATAGPQCEDDELRTATAATSPRANASRPGGHDVPRRGALLDPESQRPHPAAPRRSGGRTRKDGRRADGRERFLQRGEQVDGAGLAPSHSSFPDPGSHVRRGDELSIVGAGVDLQVRHSLAAPPGMAERLVGLGVRMRFGVSVARVVALTGIWFSGSGALPGGRRRLDRRDVGRRDDAGRIGSAVGSDSRGRIDGH
jgi:hypothetical protein